MASTLTPEQLAYFQLELGDDCSKVEEEQYQLAYDLADGDTCSTLAILNRWLLAKVKPTKIALLNGGEAYSKAVTEYYEKRVAFWEGCAGTTSGVAVSMTTTVITPERSDLPAFEPEDDAWLWGE